MLYIQHDAMFIFGRRLTLTLKSSLILCLIVFFTGNCRRKTELYSTSDKNMPNKILWAWERPEDLRFLDTNKFGVAFLAQTLLLQGDEVILRSRRQPLQISPNTYLIAVTRIESGKQSSNRSDLSDEAKEKVVSLIKKTLQLPNVKAVQIDFDATASERIFYRDVVNQLKKELPENTPLTITALASWCVGDAWFSDFPIDEAVPMAFEMGADDKTIRDFLENGKDWREPLCRKSYGVAVDKPLKINFRPNRRFFYFKSKAWEKSDLEKLDKQTYFMKNFIRFLTAIALVFGFLFNSLPPVKACGPFTVDPLFSFTKHGEYPLESYTSGKFGVVPNSYGRISLFVFYRQLNNLPLTGSEQKQVVEAMNRRIGNYTSENEAAQPENAQNQTPKVPDYFTKWSNARAKVLSGSQEITTEKRSPDEYGYYENCLGDAFNTAAKTLEERLAKFGVNENTKEWLKGQDVVFSNCGSEGKIPEAVGADAPEWLVKDRQYQIAAALFYSSKPSEARDNFAQIAADASSVWNKTAKFIVARTYIRQASFVESAGNSANDEEKKAQAQKALGEKSEFLQKAVTQLRDVLADASMSDFHDSARKLLDLVKFRLDAAGRQKELAKTLSEPSENPNIYNDLTDFIWLLDKPESDASQIGAETDQKEAEAAGRKYEYDYKLKLRDLPPNVREMDLTDWLYTYQAVDGFAHAYEKWKETRGSQWFVAALSHAEQNSPQTAELLSEAAKMQKNSAGYATVRYHQIRLLLETDKRAEARKLLDEIMADNFQNYPISTQNKFLAQRMILAENLADFLKYAPRKAATFVWSDDANEEGDDLKSDKELQPWTKREMFDEDSAAFFNEKMPLSILREAALNEQLPEHLKKFLVSAVWTRAFLLGNEQIEREFTPLMSRYAKEFAPLFSKYANAANPIDREAAAMLVILNYPVIQPYVPVGFGRDTAPPESIDSTRGNWWCAEDEATKDETGYNHYEFKYPKNYPIFLTAAQTADALREHKQIIASGNSATFLARRAVEFADKNPNQPNTPEILHLAVRATRYGCTDDKTLKYSKEAFTILHTRYPKSVWTSKTPYWFG